ncbi:MAG: hypothetical protein K2O88_10190 [Paramuribaculum sp.]|nr:hypothetical protein [Paramuribaculum sp.]
MNQAKLVILSIALAATVVSANAQSFSASKQDFDEFRKGLLNDYSSFRKGILEDYDKFLDGAWSNYRQFKGEKRNPAPKPKTIPSVEDMPAKPSPQPLPDPEPPVAQNTPSPTPDNKPVADTSVPKKTPSPRPTLLPKIPSPKPKPATPVAKPAAPKAKPVPSTPAPSQEPAKQPAAPDPTPAAPSTPVPTPKPTPVPADEPAGNRLKVKFYDVDMMVPDYDYQIAATANQKTYADQWRQLTKNKVAENVVPGLEATAKKYGLNDYLKFILVHNYADAKFPNANSASRLSLTHYLMANMGYDIRLAALDNGTAALLVPFEQFVYARPYMKIDNKQYYVFCEDFDKIPEGNLYISTCTLPKDADTGHRLDLTLSELKLPEKSKTFNIEYNGMKIQGNLNANIFPVLYRYPQMPMSGYAVSQVCPSLRADIVAQMKRNLAGLSQTEAVNKLLQFVQSGFEYATDDDFHGFEKPYFMEEILYYPKCDCEDRAIFYTYLLWNVLGVENHILNYPGHESAAVLLNDNIKGTSYTHNGKRFLISDPTYIGSVTGMCMPMFESTAPKIDHIYSK